MGAGLGGDARNCATFGNETCRKRREFARISWATTSSVSSTHNRSVSDARDDHRTTSARSTSGGRGSKEASSPRECTSTPCCSPPRLFRSLRFPLQPVPGSKKAGGSHAYRNAIFTGANPTDPRYPKTAYDCFELGLKAVPKNLCLGKREWNGQDWAKELTWQTYEEVGVHRSQVGSGLLKLKEQFANTPERWNVGIWSINRPGESLDLAFRALERQLTSLLSVLEWQWVNLACASYSMTTTVLYSTLGPDVVEYIINHAECPVVFAGSAQIPELLSLVDKLPTLKAVVSLDSWTSITPHGARPGATGASSLKAWGQSVGVQVLDIVERKSPHVGRLACASSSISHIAVEALGIANPKPHTPPAPSDCACLCYTSGVSSSHLSTFPFSSSKSLIPDLLFRRLAILVSYDHSHDFGRVRERADVSHDRSEGVMTLHSSIAGVVIGSCHGNTLYPSSVQISYLPLAHVYQYFVEYISMACGAATGYSCGDNLRLLEDFQVIKPSVSDDLCM